MKRLVVPVGVLVVMAVGTTSATADAVVDDFSATTASWPLTRSTPGFVQNVEGPGLAGTIFGNRDTVLTVLSNTGLLPAAAAVDTGRQVFQYGTPPSVESMAPHIALDHFARGVPIAARLLVWQLCVSAVEVVGPRDLEPSPFAGRADRVGRIRFATRLDLFHRLEPRLDQLVARHARPPEAEVQREVPSLRGKAEGEVLGAPGAASGVSPTLFTVKLRAPALSRNVYVSPDTSTGMLEGSGWPLASTENV